MDVYFFHDLNDMDGSEQSRILVCYTSSALPILIQITKIFPARIHVLGF